MLNLRIRALIYTTHFMKRSLLLMAMFGAVSALFTDIAGAQTPPPSAAEVAAQAAAAATASKVSGSLTLFELIQAGGWAMIPLVGLSVLTVMLILFYAITLRRNAVVSSHFMNTAEMLLKKGDYPALLAISNRHSEAIARVVQRMLDFVVKNPETNFEAVREIAQTEGGAQAAALQHRITYLADIAVLSPMVGLLGTVFGIINSFGVIASNVSNASRPVLLSRGVSEALIATGAGLIVGIVAMGFYALFRNRVQQLISDLEGASALALGLMALHFREKDEADSSDRKESTPTRKPRIAVDDEF